MSELIHWWYRDKTISTAIQGSINENCCNPVCFETNLPNWLLESHFKDALLFSDERDIIIECEIGSALMRNRKKTKMASTLSCLFVTKEMTKICVAFSIFSNLQVFFLLFSYIFVLSCRFFFLHFWTLSLKPYKYVLVSTTISQMWKRSNGNCFLMVIVKNQILLNQIWENNQINLKQYRDRFIYRSSNQT